MKSFTLNHSPSKPYQRCSPDCPYEWCRLPLDRKAQQPTQPQQGGGPSYETKKQDSTDGPRGAAPPAPANQEAAGSDADRSAGPSESSPPSREGAANTAPSEPKPAPEKRPSEPRPAPELSYEPVFKDPGGHGASWMVEEPPKPLKKAEEHVNLSDTVFRERLRSIMTDNAYDRRVRGRKRGQLDMKSLYKVPAKRDNVFTLKEARKNKRYNVLLLIDESGSMCGKKAHVAADCTIFLAKAFEGLNINVAVVGFNAFITTRKNFTEVADYDAIHEAIRTMNHGRGFGDNNDWDALNKAYQLFAKAPAGQNILIMLSDGSPAQGYLRFIDSHGRPEKPPKGTDRLDSDQKGQRKHLHQLVQSQRQVHSIGIGVLEGGWQIPHHEVIKSVNHLKPVIIKHLRQQIKRG